MRMGSRELVNLDTTALITIVSGIINGGVGKLMSTPETETRARFKCNYKFVMDDGSEFKDIVSMCGGSEEKTRASQLLKRLRFTDEVLFHT
ncbi:hypothetical protein ABZP36_030935 [Zizania latifolia]